MIINGGGRGNVGFWSRHLLDDEKNLRAEVKEISGVLAGDLPGALREMELVASGSRSQGNFLYVADISPEAHERLTEEQWREAVDLLEEKMELQGHQRVVVEHEKDGRVHRHVVWNRVDENLKVRDVGGDYYTHERVARALEERFNLERTKSRHGMQHGNDPRPPRAPDVQDYRMAEKAGTTPQERKALITDAWRQSDSKEGFKAAVSDAGYVLANGDKRDFVLVDMAGGVHSVARQIDGVTAKQVRERLGDLSSELPSVADAKTIQVYRREHRASEAERVNSAAETKPQPTPATPPAQMDPRKDAPAHIVAAKPQIDAPGKPMETIRHVLEAAAVIQPGAAAEAPTQQPVQTIAQNETAKKPAHEPQAPPQVSAAFKVEKIGRAAPVDAPAQAAPVVATPVQVPAATPPKVQVDFRVEAVGKTAPAEIKRTEAKAPPIAKAPSAPIVAPIVAKTAPRVVEAPGKASFKVLNAATGVITGLLDFLTHTPQTPPPGSVAERRQQHEVAQNALAEVIAAARKGDVLPGEHLQNLSPEHRQNLFQRGDSGLRSLLDDADYFARQQRERDQSRGR